MKRIATITKLKPNAKETYLRLHDDIWEEVVVAGHNANLRNYTIFSFGDYLISYYEYTGHDYELDMANKNSLPIIKKWQETTGELLAEEPKIILDELWHENF